RHRDAVEWLRFDDRLVTVLDRVAPHDQLVVGEFKAPIKLVALVPVTKRVEVAKEIPAFLTAASEAANDIASEARDAAESIEQSLADMD
ncbi:MAG: hypothetical protein AAFX06_32000, partial [Planctomycetota bacterium]